MSLSGSEVKVGEDLVLAGYGCSDPNATDGGTFRVGRSRVSENPIPQVGAGFITTDGPAVLCFGDAGAPAFRLAGGRREVVGVGSRTDIQRISWFAPIDSIVIDWLRGWALKSGFSICGLNGDIGCAPDITGPGTPVSASDDASYVLTTPGQVQEMVHGAGVGSLPLTIAVHRAGETLGDLVQRVCGFPQPAAYMKQLISLAELGSIPLSPENLSLEVRFDRPGKLLLPPCSEAPTGSDRVITVDTGDSPLRYYEQLKREAERSGERLEWTEQDFLKAFREANPTVEMLRPGQQVLVPERPVAAPGSVQLQPPVPAPGELDLAPDVSPQQSDDECNSNTTPIGDGYPYPLEQLLDALNMNAAQNSGIREKALVLSPDSGVWIDQKRGPFSEHNVNVRSWEDSTVIDLATPTSDDSHGTSVASLLLGGPIFARMHLFMDPRLQIRPRRIYDDEVIMTLDENRKQVPTTIRRYNPRAIIQELQGIVSGFAVVNLSLLDLKETIELSPYFGSDNIFFVFAAGNGAVKVSASPEVFPAIHGREDNAITVAALLPGTPARLFSKSNWDDQVVQIAAPGCAVPVISYDYERERFTSDRLSGTSFAAPLVAFAAALIRAEGGNSFGPVDIKARLRYSADLHPELKKPPGGSNAPMAVEDGRVLNIVKAISLFDDVIELTDGSLLRGNLGFVEQKPDGQGTVMVEKSDTADIPFCDGTVSVSARDLYKIVPEYEAGKARVYYRKAGEMVVDTCALPSNWGAVIKDDYKQIVHKDTDFLRFDQIKDIVRKHTPLG